MGKCPNVEIFGPKEFKFPYISSHIYFIISELLKNSFKATVDFHFNKEILPSIKIYISGGCDALTIKVSDEGGGISRKNIKNIWGYMFTTSNHNFEQIIENDGYIKFFNIDFNNIPILSGFGIGFLF
jgi:pyruvate dehydrogenase kinase 2/3/4